MVNLLRFVLLFFIAIITSLWYTLAFYEVSNPEAGADPESFGGEIQF